MTSVYMFMAKLFELSDQLSDFRRLPWDFFTSQNVKKIVDY